MIFHCLFKFGGYFDTTNQNCIAAKTHLFCAAARGEIHGSWFPTIFWYDLICCWKFDIGMYPLWGSGSWIYHLPPTYWVLLGGGGGVGKCFWITFGIWVWHNIMSGESHFNYIYIIVMCANISLPTFFNVNKEADISLLIMLLMHHLIFRKFHNPYQGITCYL